MKRPLRVLPAALLTIAASLGTSEPLRAEPFGANRIIIEVNESDGDGGIQVFVDGPEWHRLAVFDPAGQKVFDVFGSHSVGVTGLTELFFESAEPSFEDLPLDQLLMRFPEGRYRFEGITVDGRLLTGAATLGHNIPAGPVVVAPAEGATLVHSAPVVIDWDPVTQAFHGTALPVTVVGYQVIVEREKPKPQIAFSITLPAAVTSVTVPSEFVEAKARYKLEVLAIERSGNQTITESSFQTE